MVKYYYDKYNTVDKVQYRETGFTKTGANTQFFASRSGGYYFDSWTGKFSEGSWGYQSGGTVSIGDTAYPITGEQSSITKWVAKEAGSTDKLLQVDVYSNSSTQYTDYSKGSLVQSNIIAEDGTYPTNGRYSADGYWYVRGAVAETSPGTVVAQPYSTEGNGGRKLVRLENGWFIAAVKNMSGYYLFVSKDNGKTFNLFFNQNITGTVLSSDLLDVALVPLKGTKIAVLYTYYGKDGAGKNGTPLLYSSIIDVSSENRLLDKTIGGTYTSLSNVSLAIDPSNGHLHAAWASKNATHPNSFNIQYAKSTDEGATWSTPTQVTATNTSGVGFENPSIVITNDGKPTIIMEAIQAGVNGIHVYKPDNRLESNSFTTSSGFYRKTIYNGGTYAQSSPSAVVDKDGVIYTAWHGKDSSTPSYFKSYFAKSTDGGVTWNTFTRLAPYNIDSHYTNATITIDKTGKLFVLTGRQDGAIVMNTSIDGGAKWTDGTQAGLGTNYPYPSALYDTQFSGVFGSIPPYIYQTGTSVKFEGPFSTNNAPTLTLNTENNKTLYENDSFLIDGSAIEIDKGNIVNVKYQINGGQVRAIATEISNGTKPILFSEQLTFKAGKLFYEDTAITDALSEGVAHQLKVWSGDDQGGKSAEQTRSFFVVPNRAPVITINPIEKPTGVIDSDKFPISGACSDPDGNDVIVSYKINTSLATEIYRGKGGDWTFDVAFSSLKVGENIIIVEVIDSHNFKTSKTIKLNKAVNKTPVLNSVARYKIVPPTGTAKGVLFWIQKEKGLNIDAEISMTEAGVQEKFIGMPLTNSAPIDSFITEDQFVYEAAELKENIIVKLNLSRESAEVSDSITLISGVLS